MKLDRKLIDTVRRGRSDKREARARELYLGGRPTTEFNKHWPEVEAKTVAALEEHADLISADWHRIQATETVQGKSKRLLSVVDVRAAFQKAFLGRMKAAVLMEKSTWKDLADKDEDFDILIEQAIFDFVMTLRRSGRRDDTALSALTYAGLSHWIAPGEYDRLANAHPAVDKTVIAAAIVSNPKDPDSVVMSYEEGIQRLMQKYQQKVDVRDIKYALHNYPKNPERFVQWFKDTRDALATAHPWLDEKRLRPILYANHFKTVSKLLDIAGTLRK